MHSNFVIIIPSRGRAGKPQFRTLDSVPFSLRGQTVLFLTAGDPDIPQYRELYEHRVKRIVVVEADNLSTKRQRMQEWALREGYDTVVQLDDDLVFHHREEPWIPGVMTSLSPPLHMQEDLEEMFKHFLTPSELSDEPYPLISLCERQLSVALQDTRGWKEVGRCLCAFAWDVDWFNTYHIYFDEMASMSDYFIGLQVLTKGWKTAIDVEYVFNQAAQAVGGCSLYRTNETYEASARRLQEIFPQFVKLSEKKDGRTDVRIAWKKAFESGFEERMDE